MSSHWLLRGDLPPAGNPVLLAKGAASTFAGYAAHWLNSGTAALALALMIARARASEVAEPRVILPTYGCPDLVAAAEFARVRPLLVDIDADDPGYSLQALERAMDERVVAVVAVNFLGIRERLAEIRAVLRSWPRAVLVEDDAQWLPEPLSGHGLASDLVCLSFGRGKPVSLLGGGALLIKEGSGLVPPAGIVRPAPQPSGSYALKAQVFNALLSRHLYWLANRNPALSLGQTIFKPLTAIHAMDAGRASCLGPNVSAYVDSSRAIEAAWRTRLPASMRLKSDADERRGRLLRFPLLLESEAARDRALHALGQAGLGATAMYRRPLIEIEGVREKVDLAGGHEGARSFASRFLTLPVHQGVKASDVALAASLLHPA